MQQLTGPASSGRTEPTATPGVTAAGLQHISVAFHREGFTMDCLIATQRAADKGEVKPRPADPKSEIEMDTCESKIKNQKMSQEIMAS